MHKTMCFQAPHETAQRASFSKSERDRWRSHQNGRARCVLKLVPHAAAKRFQKLRKRVLLDWGLDPS